MHCCQFVTLKDSYQLKSHYLDLYATTKGLALSHYFLHPLKVLTSAEPQLDWKKVIGAEVPGFFLSMPVIPLTPLLVLISFILTAICLRQAYLNVAKRKHRLIVSKRSALTVAENDPVTRANNYAMYFVNLLFHGIWIFCAFGVFSYIPLA